MENLVQEIAQILFEKKGFNIWAADVRGLSPLSDFILIAEGFVPQHVKAMAEAVQERMKEKGRVPIAAEGIREGDWIVLDFWEIIIHLFIPELRERYQLEKMWPEAKILELPLVEAHNVVSEA